MPWGLQAMSRETNAACNCQHLEPRVVLSFAFACVSPWILKSQGTLLVRRTFGFLLVKMPAYYIYLSLGLYRNLKALIQLRVRVFFFFFIAVLVIIIQSHSLLPMGLTTMETRFDIFKPHTVLKFRFRDLWCAGLGHVSYTLFNKLTQCARSPLICNIFW